jgi:hypothetical protein
MCAYHIIGDAGYLRYSTNRLGNKFSKGTIVVHNLYKEYIELQNHNETYELRPPSIRIQNIIFGSMYLDPASNAFIKNIHKPEQYADIEFHKRGWDHSTYFRVTGKVYSGPGKIAYLIDGRWSE